MTDLKMLWQQFTNKEGGEKKRRDRWMLLALFGILILVIVWPVGSKSKEADNQVSESVAGTEKRTYNYAEQYTASMELRLKEILENVDGAGAVQVMITVKNNGEQVVEKDKSYSESKTIQSGDGGKNTPTANTSRSESTVYDRTDSGSPYVVKQLEPEIEGVLVAAQGAGDETVVNEITYAVQVLFDVPVHKIKVVKMSSR